MVVSVDEMNILKRGLLDTPVIGKTINLRLVREEDADFILNLRLNTEKGKYISVTSPDIQKQKDFIAYSLAQASEFYFIIESKEAEQLGTVRIYDVQGESFCWGSWIIKDKAPFNTSIESALLIYEFAFSRLQFSQSHFDVRKQNEKVVSFHLKMGSQIIREDDIDCFFIYKKEDYETTRKRYAKFLPNKYPCVDREIING